MQEEEIEEKEQESSKLAKIIGWINASKGFITATAALLASVGALAKPQDHSVTKTAYDTLSSGIKEISDEQKRDHDDVVALRGYLEGLTREKITLSQAVAPPVIVKPDLHKKAGGSRHPASVAPTQEPVIPTPIASAQKPVPEPPLVHQEVKRMKLPAFDTLMK